MAYVWDLVASREVLICRIALFWALVAAMSARPRTLKPYDDVDVGYRQREQGVPILVVLASRSRRSAGAMVFIC